MNNQVLKTFPQWLFHHALTRPDHTAMREKDLGIWQIFTWKDVAKEVPRIAHGLMALDVQFGEHVAVIGENRPQLYMAMMAIQSLGAIPVPLYQDAIAQEMIYILQDANVRIVFVEDQEQTDKILEIKSQLPDLHRIIYDDPRGLRHYDNSSLISYLQLLDMGDKQAEICGDEFDRRLQSIKPEDTAAMFYTSGTTGKPKGVVLTHHALILSALVIEKLEHLDYSEEVLAYLPPAWIGQNMFSYTQFLVTGFTVNHPESPSTVAIDMHDIGPTYYFSPPRVLEELLTHVMIRMEDAGRLQRWLFKVCMNIAKEVGVKILDKQPVPFFKKIQYSFGNFLIYAPLRNALGMNRIKVAYTAGEAIGPDLFRFYRSIGINLKQLYGSTETSVFVCVQKDGQVNAETVGYPVEGVQLRISKTGELQINSPSLFKEYYKNEQATAEVYTDDGWFQTGDAGIIGEDGQLRIIDRAKDVSELLDGHLFAPKYMENKLKFFSFIKEVVVFGAKQAFCCAFINIDLEAVANWAERRSIAYAGYTDLSGKPEVYELIANCINQANAEIAKDSLLAGMQIRRFVILHKELDPDDGELTRTRKVRRAFIAEKYAELVQAMFSDKKNQYVETEVQYEDGSKGSLKANLKIYPAVVV